MSSTAVLTVELTGVCIIIFCYTGQSVTSQLLNLAFIIWYTRLAGHYNFSQTPDYLSLHVSYYIDFRQLHFGLHVKVNAGGCTHQYKLEVDSVFNVFSLAARPRRRLLLLFRIAAAVRARTAVGYSQSISSSRTLLATVLSSGKNISTDSMRACMNCQKTQFLL